MVSDYRWLRLSCSGCDVQLRVGIEDVGKKVSCPTCNAVRDIPTEQQLEILLNHVGTLGDQVLGDDLPQEIDNAEMAHAAV